jgi:hypothetical protein
MLCDADNSSCLYRYISFNAVTDVVLIARCCSCALLVATAVFMLFYVPVTGLLSLLCFVRCALML